MTVDLWTGIPLALASGLLAGVCMVPMKLARNWKWENIWLVFSLVSLVLIPWALAIGLVRDLGTVYSGLSWGQLGVPAGFGFGWGIAQVLFGLSIARLGLALAYAIIIGLGASLGTLVPLLVQSSDVLGTRRGNLVLGGVAIMLAGISVAAWAGRQRENLRQSEAPAGQRGYTGALLLAILCGVMAPMINFSFAFGQEIAAAAVRTGTRPDLAGYAVWPVALAGGLIPNLVYSIWLLNRNRTWGHFSAWLPDLRHATVMGILWMGAIGSYGLATAYLGRLGTSVGWGLSQTFMIITAYLSGMLTGEWTGAPSRLRAALAVGLVLLAAAMVVMSLGNL